MRSASSSQGPTVFICDECVELCMDIIREENKTSLVKSKEGVPSPTGNLQGPAGLCDRPGQGQARPVGGRAQSLQAPQPRRSERRCGAVQVQHPADRPDRLRQDAAGPDAGAHSRRALHHGRRHHADRSRLCGRGRGEHRAEAAAVGGLQCRARPARHRLYRRNRQDQPQVRQSRPSPATCRARACSRPC
jgi:hypothetical protein